MRNHWRFEWSMTIALPEYFLVAIDLFTLDLLAIQELLNPSTAQATASSSNSLATCDQWSELGFCMQHRWNCYPEVRTFHAGLSL